MKTKSLFLITFFASQAVLMMVAAQEPQQGKTHEKVSSVQQQVSPSGKPDLSFFDDWIAELEGDPKKKVEKKWRACDLIQAAEKNDVPAILAYEGDVNEMVDMPQYHYRLNALHAAARDRQKEAVEALLMKKNADPNLCAVEIKGPVKKTRYLSDDYCRSKVFCGDKKSPLQWAIGDQISASNKKIDKDIILLLLKAGANPNVVDCFGYPPLYFVVNFGLTEIAIWLIDAGADANPEKKFSVSSLEKYEHPNSYAGDRALSIYDKALPSVATALKTYFANRKIAEAFAAILHPRCGAQSAWIALPPFVVQKIVNYLKPRIVQEEYTGGFHCEEQNCVYRADSIEKYFRHQEQCGHYEKMYSQLCGE